MLSPRPSLGEINIESTAAGVVCISHDGRTIEIRIIADEIPYCTAVDVAAEMVQNLPKLDEKAKHIAASKLTDTYNSGWNEYDEAQEDGTFKSVFKPILTQEEFAKKLMLNAINVTGNMLNFFYDNEGMFWGHSIIVTSMDGTTFTDTHVELFG